MALGGFKNFATGAVLTEADLDDYLMGQALMHFATTAARDAAITAPVAGMHVVIDASVRLWQFYDGAAWVTYRARGAGTPEGAVTAGIGATYQRTDGGANTTLYVKESGSGNTGWVAYGAPSGGASTPEGFDAERSSAQTLLAATFTKIVFNNQIRDDGSDYDPSTGEWTVPATGWYDVATAIEFTSMSDTNRGIVALYIGGVENRRFGDHSQGAGNTMVLGGSIPMYLTSGNVVTIYAFRTSAGDIGTDSYFTAKRNWS